MEAMEIFVAYDFITMIPKRMTVVHIRTCLVRIVS